MSIVPTLSQPYPPMEAETADELPIGPFQYEPKWDGFRCLVFREGEEVVLQSKAGQPLGRYFPELVEAAKAVKAAHFVLDGEIVVPVEGVFSFDDLLQRIHPAASRVRTLSERTPALLLVFDLLVDERGHSLVDAPIEVRRPKLEAFAKRFPQRFKLSPATTDPRVARDWFEARGAPETDGVIAKRLGIPYRSGTRDGMTKVKRLRTADCVVGGYRLSQRGDTLGSLLLGLYDDDGRLHHVGFTSSFKAHERAGIFARVAPLKTEHSFDEQLPGGPSRWSRGRETAWVPVRPDLVVEVRYDHFTQGRFRHGTKLLRWRPDKAPAQCGFDQLQRRSPDHSPRETPSIP